MDQNSDGVSYIGLDNSEDNTVIIREFFPRQLSRRSEDGRVVAVTDGCESAFFKCLSEFKKLWKELAILKNLSCLFPVYDIFEENQTVYTVSEYIPFVTLEQYLNNRDGAMRREEARPLFMPALSTLGNVHAAGIVHGGISPKTLILCNDNRLRLAGFSIEPVRKESGELTAELFPGYAAIEQYGFDGSLSARTDLYAFAGCIYRALTGNNPIDAKLRVTSNRLSVPKQVAQITPMHVLNALGHALEVLPKERTANVERFRAEISAAPTVTAAREMPELQPKKATVPQSPVRQDPAPPVRRSAPKTSNKKSSTPLIIALVSVISVGILICLFLIGLLIFRPSGDEPQTEITTQEISTTVEQLTVPNLLERSYLAIQNDDILNENYEIIISFEFSETTDGVVFEQSPNAGEQIEKGGTITVKVSKGVEKVELPVLNDLPKKAAQEKLDALGFEYDIIKKYNDGTHTANCAAGTDLQPNKEYPKGTRLTLFIWDEPEEHEAQE